jgi:hypothetical protein
MRVALRAAVCMGIPWLLKVVFRLRFIGRRAGGQ